MPALRISLTAIPLFALLAPATAVAEPPVDEVGMRVGGYGFREAPTGTETMSPSHTGWEACRMNGIGIFASKNLDRTFFLEGAVDSYFAETFPTGEAVGTYDTPIDRVSGLMTLAAGARMYPDSRVSPYLQAGIGAELTRVSLPELGLEDTAVLPFGFFGLGGDLRVGDKLRLGASLRVNLMGYYDDSQFQSELSPEAELATQGQFYARYAL